MSELNQAPKSVDAPNEDFFRSATTTGSGAHSPATQSSANHSSSPASASSSSSASPLAASVSTTESAGKVLGGATSKASGAFRAAKAALAGKAATSAETVAPETPAPSAGANIRTSRAPASTAGAALNGRSGALTGQVRRTISGAGAAAGAAAGAVVTGSVDAVRGAAGVPATVPQRTAGSSATRRTRKARLRLSRVDPWSVMKTSFLFAIAGGIILFVAVWVVWGVVNASGAFDSVNTAANDLLASPGSETKFTLESYINTPKVLGFTALIAAADVVIFTALATLFSFLYNLAATVLGGLEVTLAED